MRNFRSNVLFSFISLFITGIGLVFFGKFISPKKTANHYGENPGYFDQWFEEKKDANGKIPAWLRQQWQQADIRNQATRSHSEIFDTIIELGPRSIGGRTRSVWVDPTNDNLILAAAISGGIWRSETKGNSWTAINDHEVSLMASCITSNPFNNDIIYYGTGESRANSADVNGNGVFKSLDRGKTFKQISSTVGKLGFEAIWDISHSLDDSNTLFVGTHSNGLHRSKDGGTTWESVYNSGNKQVNDILVLPNKRILISMQSNGVLASDSNGNTGTFSTLVFPNRPASGTFRRIQLANSQKYPNVVYAIFEGYEFSSDPVAFYKSSDGGRTWTKRTTPVDIGPSYQAYCILLGASNVDSNYVVAGGVDAAYSLDGGNSWKRLNGSHSDHHCFAGFNQTSNEFMIGTDGGMYRCKWGTSNVVQNMNNGYQVTQFYAGAPGFSGLKAVSGAQDNGTQYATNRLVSSQIFGGDGAYCFVGMQDGSIAYVSTQNEGIRRFENFGGSNQYTQSINAVEFTSDGVSFINPYTMNYMDQYMLFYRTNKGIYRTVDGGESWEKVNGVNRSSLKAVSCSYDENPVLYFGGGSAQLYKIENAATAIGGEISYNNSVPSDVTNDFLNCIAVNPKNKYQIFVAFSNINSKGRVWKVSNLDSAKPVWVDISGNLPVSLPVNFVAVDPNDPENVIFAATDFGLYYTVDGGKNWEKEMSIPNVAVFEVKIRLSDRTLFAFTHGRGMWYLKLKNREVSSLDNKLKTTVTAFPNPAKDFVHIKASSPIEQIQVYNLQGKLVHSNNPFRQEYELNTEKLEIGIYFAKIKTKEGFSTHKIMIHHP